MSLNSDRDKPVYFLRLWKSFCLFNRICWLTRGTNYLFNAHGFLVIYMKTESLNPTMPQQMICDLCVTRCVFPNKLNITKKPKKPY